MEQSHLPESLFAPDGLGAYWSLTPSGVQESQFDVKHFMADPHHTEESVYDPDFRSVVDKKDYEDGGKYRAIVKLIIKYEGQAPGDDRWAMGTGWLISEDIFVTAGHCVYDWADDGTGFGRVSLMKCYIGYYGKASVSSPTVQSRVAKTVATTRGWLTSKDNKNRDVAFVRVDRPFTGDLRVFSYVKATPEQGTEQIGVVGYPADQRITDDEGQEERGAKMYELFQGVKYDRSSDKLHMLNYKISTFGGQSGSPVIRKGARANVIGTHCYGSDTFNQASPIGPDGTNYDVFIAAFKNPNALIKEITKPLPPSRGGGTSGAESEMQSEDFFDVLKTIGRTVTSVGQSVLPIASPLLGPLGGPISAAAGLALGALGKVSSESTSVNGDGALLPPRTSPAAQMKGATERVVLAEAALQSVLRLEDGRTRQAILKKMAAKYKDMSPAATKVAPKLVPILMHSALSMAVDSNGLQKVNTKPKVIGQKEIIISGTESGGGDANAAKFIAAARGQKVPVHEDAEGWILDNIGGFLSTGLQAAKPLLYAGAKAGLTKLGEIIDKQAAKTESSIDEKPTAVSDNEKAATLLVKRAVMAEAALQAVTETSESELRNSYIPDTHGPTAEGFFSGLLSVAQNIGGMVFKAAPTIMKTAVPIVLDALSPPPQQVSPALAAGSLATPASGSHLHRRGALSFAAALPVSNSKPVGAAIPVPDIFWDSGSLIDPNHKKGSNQGGANTSLIF